MNDTEMILQAIGGIKEEIKGINTRLDKMEGDLSTVKGDLSTVKGDLSTVKGDLSTVKGDLSTLTSKVTRLEIIVENDIRSDIKKLSEHQLGLREQLEEYKEQVDDRLGTSDLINILTEYSRKHS